jgi:Uncharacterised protein family (UPF0158)
VLPTQQAQLVGRPNPSKRLRNQDNRALEPGKPYLSASRAFWIWSAAGGGSIVAFVLDLSLIDLEDIAIALADQNDYEHHWLINLGIGEIAFWTADTGIDGQTPVDLDELDLIVIDPLPTWVWYQDMADFASGLTSERAGQRLARAIRGKGAFRRFKDELHEEYQDLLPAWYAFSDARAMRRAVQWLADNSLIDDDSAELSCPGTQIPP